MRLLSSVIAAAILLPVGAGATTPAPWLIDFSREHAARLSDAMGRQPEECVLDVIGRRAGPAEQLCQAAFHHGPQAVDPDLQVIGARLAVAGKQVSGPVDQHELGLRAAPVDAQQQCPAHASAQRMDRDALHDAVDRARDVGPIRRQAQLQ